MIFQIFCKVPPKLSVAILLALLTASHGLFATEKTARLSESFDSDWRFLKADAPGADRSDFDDASWRVLDVPHDWSIQGPFDEHNSTTGSGGYLPAGIGWYRRHFALPENAANRKVSVEFDGVMANSDVWINGFYLGHFSSGYVSFGYDLTGHLNFGSRPNVLAVKADNSLQPASRWYSGAGIYRHVRLVTTNRIHLQTNGLFISTPHVSKDHATVHVHGSIINESASSERFNVHLALYDPAREKVADLDLAPQTVAPGKVSDFDRDIELDSPKRWALTQPALYCSQVEVRAGNILIDNLSAWFGIREIEFRAESGFWLNGTNLKLKGVCLHNDASALGTAVPLSEWRRRLTELKEIGVNAIRTAHNPPAPEFLDLCDRMGFLVMDELFDCWTVAKNPYDYHLYFEERSKADVRDTVRRDRNHPSIILYSAGNEIHDTPNAELSKRILSGLVATFHESDPTRPVTQALFRPNVSHDYDDGLADLLDVIGTNYRFTEILAAHVAQPSRKIVGTENKHDLASWLAVRDNPPYAGEFIWSGIDYLGESAAWPFVASGSGLLDRTGKPHPDGEIFRSWWSDTPSLYVVRRIAPSNVPEGDPGFVPLRQRQVLFADWTPREPVQQEQEVEVYSNADDVELYLNDRSLGKQPIAQDLAVRRWKVPFEPGSLKAVGTRAGQPPIETVLQTAGAAARIVLSADRATLSPGWDEVDYITATIVDEHGVPVPDADNLVRFESSGPGTIVAVDSADNTSHEAFQSNVRHCFRGRASALIRATGTAGSISIRASSPSLIGASVVVLIAPDQTGNRSLSPATL